MRNNGPTKATKLEIQIREHRDTDRNYIIDSWLRSYRPTVPWVPTHIYLPEMHARVGKLLNRAGVIVACDPSDDDFIFGWACIQDDTVHYAFIRKAFQRAGVATRLLASRGLSAPLKISHYSRNLEGFSPGVFKFLPSRLEGLHYDKASKGQKDVAKK